MSEEIASTYRGRLGEHVAPERHLDLWTAAEQLLHAAGVQWVDRLDLCTACHADRFFSHRRDHGTTGRQGMIGYVT